MENDGIQEGLAVGKIKRRRISKKMLVIIFAIILVAGAVFGFYYVSDENEDVVTICAGSPTSIVQNDLSALLETAPRSKTIIDTVGKIQSTPGYEADVNCMYILTLYYSKISDPENARKSLNGLIKVYTSEVAISELVGGSTYTIEQLTQEVEFVESLVGEDQNISTWEAKQ